MEALEIAMLWLSKHASAVADKKLMVQWVAEVEISLMSMIFAAPKFPTNGQTHREQETALTIACGQFIAGKLVDLVKLASQPLTVEHLKNMTYPQNDIFASVKTALENGSIGKVKGTATNSSKPSEKEALQPKPVQLDSDGKVISTHATHEPKAPTQVQTVSWRPWLDAQFLNHDEICTLGR